jgi:magnesium chelatase subunit D
MMMFKEVYPYSAIVGQEGLKLPLILNAVNPKIGGVLIRGEKGTAKSTSVRALAAILPEVKIVKGCPYSCDPNLHYELCDCCRRFGKDHEISMRRKRVITLPLNATEDRVAGGIDFNLAIREGVRAVQPGLLADAHRGILYVDEVNLLDDHIVDIILNAAASGENILEREGISFRHPSRFILVGTMNPEEGELRPQLLDRFGLCVEVVAESDREKRILLMERREEYDMDPAGFCRKYRDEDKKAASQIMQARRFLKGVSLPKHMRTFICELCTENYVAGHRADIIMEQAAKALAALHERLEVTIDDIRQVAPLVLAHRMRDPAPAPPPPRNNEDNTPPQEESEDETQREEEHDQDQDQEELESNDDHQAEEDKQPEQQPSELNETENNGTDEENILDQIFEVGSTFRVKKITSPKDRAPRRGSGRRSRSRTSQKQGRYVKSTTQRKTGDIALDATLRAAAPYQCRRKGESELAVCLKQEDILEKVREKRVGNFLLFLVDASGSMGARGRMVASKGAIMSLLLDAYQKRDKVAMISFRKDEALVNLPPTSSVEVAGKLLKEMPIGGRTPLCAGLVKGFEQIRNYLLKEPTSRPIAIIITDGKANQAMGSKKPLEEALEFASRMALDERIQFVVIDTEDPGLVSFGLARKFAAVLNARYFKTEDLKADKLINIVKERLL